MGSPAAVASVAAIAPVHPWDGYLTGPENELAMAAARAIARGEPAGLSPLVVHGPSGVGKSRLLAGLVAERLLREPGAAVAHLDAETFAASYAEAAGDGGAGVGARGAPAVATAPVSDWPRAGRRCAGGCARSSS